MNEPPLAVLDLGDVLIRTRPGAQYEALQNLTGVPASIWAGAADNGLTEALELGRLDFPSFAEQLCRSASAGPVPPLDQMRTAFCATITGLEPLVADAAHELARQGRLLLASNTSEPHWARIQALLADRGITAPACLSFEIGHRKPDDAYFKVLAAMDKRVSDHAAFIDDRAEHVVAARRHGMEAIRHKSPAFTSTWLHAVARLAPGSF